MVYARYLLSSPSGMRWDSPRETAWNDVDEGNAPVQCRLAHEREVHEILIAIVVRVEIVMVVADQVRLDDIDVLAQVLPVGLYGAAGGAERDGAGVRGKQVDVGQVGGVALADVVDESCKLRKPDGAGLVGDCVGIQGGMVFDAGDDRVDPRLACRVVEAAGALSGPRR